MKNDVVLVETVSRYLKTGKQNKMKKRNAATVFNGVRFNTPGAMRHYILLQYLNRYLHLNIS